MDKRGSMGRITATCGHEIPEISDKYCVTRKRYTRDNLRSVSFEVACLECQRRYLKWGEILKDEKEEMAWLRLQ